MALCTKARTASSLLTPKTPRGLRLGKRNRPRFAHPSPDTLDPATFPSLSSLLRLDLACYRSDKFEPLVSSPAHIFISDTNLHHHHHQYLLRTQPFGYMATFQFLPVSSIGLCGSHGSSGGAPQTFGSLSICFTIHERSQFPRQFVFMPSSSLRVSVHLVFFTLDLPHRLGK